MLGLIFIVIGVIFLLKNLGYISADAWGIILPALLIIFGAFALLKRKSHGFYWGECCRWLGEKEGKNGSASSPQG